MPSIGAKADAVERPGAPWWIAILSGMGLLAVLALHAGAYAWWSEHVTKALSRPLLQWILAAAVLVHVGEGLQARRIALRGGLRASANGWFWQTLLLGFPSMILLRRRITR